MARKIMWIRWRDAAFELKNLDDGDIDRYEALTVMESVGFLVQENKESIVLAIDRNDEGEYFRGITSIPKVNIVKKRVFRVEGKS